MNKVYIVYFGENYEHGDVTPFTSLDKAKAAADKDLDNYDYCYVTEHTLINGDYVENPEPVYWWG